ncbi:MAG: glycosyltransferase family 4 protein [Bdellovibrionales bacterium]
MSYENRGNRRIVHGTSAHPRYDVRIFLKQCRSVSASKEFDTHLVVADGLGDEIRDNVKIHDVGRYGRGRAARMIVRAYRVFCKVLELRPDLFHFHDPELIPYGILLRLMGYRVVFDVHESLPKQVLDKPWIPGLLRKPVAALILCAEQVWFRALSASVAATTSIESRIRGYTRSVIGAYNYPMRDELSAAVQSGAREAAVCYVGVITRARGILPLIESLERTPMRLHLIGEFENETLRLQAQQMRGWANVVYHGQCERKKVAQIMAQCQGGVVTFLPLANHFEAMPNKLFEYLSAGLPVIASDFPAWRELLDGESYGWLVDPNNSQELARVFQEILNHPEEAASRGRAGRRAVIERFNWETEATKILNLYKQLLSKP